MFRDKASQESLLFFFNFSQGFKHDSSKQTCDIEWKDFSETASNITLLKDETLIQLACKEHKKG
jgi:hypothetical protein